MKIRIKDLIKEIDATLICGDEENIIDTFSKDTRTINEGDTYIGIKGETFDGNKYYMDAFNNGATAAILDSYDNNYEGDKVIILVDNTITAIGKIASYIRKISTSKFIGVTGSVGKTTTRDMITSILSINNKVLSTNGNLNNHIGVPLTMMEINELHNISLIEMGMNHLNEIDYLTKIVRPEIGIITNVGTAHIGELGSRENILKAKLEILNGMNEDSLLIINNDNDLLHNYYINNKRDNILTTGINNESDIMAYDLVLKEESSSFKVKYKDNSYDFDINIPGKEIISDALIAILIGFINNVDYKDIYEGLLNTKLTTNRLEIANKGNIRVIKDAYNASLQSIKLASNVLNTYNRRKVLVLGDVLELGTFSESIHREIGEYVSSLNIDQYVYVGDNMKYAYEETLKNNKDTYHFNTLEDANEFLIKNSKDEDVILFKASHGMNFAKLINMYLEN